MRTLFYALFSMILFTSCDKAGSASNAATAQPLPTRKNLNVPYGNDSLQRMDIYLPAGRSAATTPSIILIHGGGWNSGDKSQFASYIDTFQMRMPHYAIFNINYRLVSNRNLFPTQEQDVKSAVDFIVAHANEYGINKDQLVVLGASAGAHLALLQSYKYTEPKIKAVIDFFGPTDLVTMYNHPWHPMIPYLLQMLTGTTPAANPEIYQQSSPAYFVTGQTPPTLILQGGSDNIVDPSQSKLLSEKLDKAGVRHEMIVYPKERHGWYGATLSNSFDRIEAFLSEPGF